MNDHILIIEDDEKIARVIQLELEYEGYEVSIAYTGREGLAVINSKEVDLVILDVMIPELNGMEVLRRIRHISSEIIVIMLTARNSIFDKVSGLDLGANDYMTKPFEIEELLARIRTNLRFKPRSSTDFETDALSIHSITINKNTREVYNKGKMVELTPREYELLIYLVTNKNRALDREQILNEVWGYDYFGDTNVVDVYIRYLRKKLTQSKENQLIQTVRGVGYMIKD
ncbi:response regulator transcription factor [Siminovitchia acidinfaciens]|uniref:Response regulator transcription factor n=1 Tax=Siminovitchia acidinfaciens TaxID=2321395 RepID=A0A429XVH0_9BACI|nr:response regulator transcription factor [Siminovitchia acidinfaciens]RST72263.1 response regulator transcription factor [Siminovitchia acidinfaciens]